MGPIDPAASEHGSPGRFSTDRAAALTLYYSDVKWGRRRLGLELPPSLALLADSLHTAALGGL